MEGLLICAAGSAAGALAHQLVFSTISAAGSAAATTSRATASLLGGGAAGLLSAAGCPLLGCTARATAQALGVVLEGGLTTGHLVLASAASTASGVLVCLLVSSAAHLAHHGASAAAAALLALQMRQLGLGEWPRTALVEDLDALRWVVLGSEEECGQERGADRLFLIFSARTSPLSARSAFNAYLSAVASEHDWDGAAACAPGAGAAGAAAAVEKVEARPECWVLIPLPKTYHPQP